MGAKKMSDLAVITLIGSIADVSVKTTKTGSSYLVFFLDVMTKDTQEQSGHGHSLYSCIYFGKGAEVLSNVLKKGTRIGVTGEPAIKAKDGVRYINIKVDRITIFSDAASAKKEEEKELDVPF